MTTMNVFRTVATASMALGLSGAAASADSGRHRLSPGSDLRAREIDDRERMAIRARIGFVREDDGRRRAFIVSASGKDAAPMSSSDGRDHGYPAGGELVLEVGEREERLVMSTTGRVLATAPMIRNPATSPDGSRIVYESSESSFRDLFMVLVAHEESQANVQRITDNPEGNYEPSFFPDNRTIAFTSSRDGQAEIYRMDVVGGRLPAARRLTWSAGDDLAPRVSPDGSRIAFLSARTGEDRVWVMGANGEAPRLVDQRETVVGTTTEREHTWSPDGRFLVFVSANKAQPLAQPRARILRWDVATDAVTALTDGASSCDMPKVSPDGRYIAFVKGDADGRPDVWLMRSVEAEQNGAGLGSGLGWGSGSGWGLGAVRLIHAEPTSVTRKWLPTWVP